MKLKRNFALSLIILLALISFMTFNVSAQPKSSEDIYITILKESYFPGIQYKDLTVGETLSGLEKAIKENEELDGTHSFNVSDASDIGHGQGKYVQMIIKVNNTAISVHFWIDKNNSYVEYLGGEMNDNGNLSQEEIHINRFISLAYNTALSVAEQK